MWRKREKDGGAITVDDAGKVVVGKHFEVRARIDLVPRDGLIALAAETANAKTLKRAEGKP